MDFPWIPFYEAAADKLASFSGKRAELFRLVRQAAADEPLMRYLHFEKK